MISQEERLQELAATEILNMLINVHTIMKISAPTLTGVQEATYRLLGILECDGSSSMTDLCNRMFISKTYMTRLVDRLVAEGSVQRQSDERDRRVIIVSLTDMGRDYLRNLLRELKKNMKPLLSELASSDLESICNASRELQETFLKIPTGTDPTNWSFYMTHKKTEK